jgi:hypothetical protein
MGWMVNAKPRPFTPGKETWYPLYRKLALGPVWTCEKNSPPPAIDPWTVQSIESRYTDYVVLATSDIADHQMTHCSKYPECAVEN